ncbi:MAG: hypothetical protein KF861_16105 [Planctomycetaceae bacterium]|nr:hypothetical protein [Planctomycetaceae bacterium]
MSSEVSDIIRGFSIDGPIGLPGAIGLAVALAGLFAWLLWLARRATGPGWAGLFWVLRVAALCLVLAMLLGPSWVTRHRTTKQHAIAVLVDTSASMDVHDAPEAAGQQRWGAASAGAGDDDALTRCDRAVVAVRMASRRTREAREAVERHQPPASVRQRVDIIEEAVTRGIQHLEAARKSLPSSTERETADRFERLLQMLEGGIVADLHQVQSAVSGDSSSGVGDVWESLQALEESLAAAARRTDDLIRLLDRELESVQSARTAHGNGMSRREHVAHTLTHVDSGSEREERTGLSVKRVGFDRQAAPLPAEGDWANLLLQGESGAPTPWSAANGDASTKTIHGTAEDASDDALLAVTDVAAALDLLGRTSSAESIRSAILITDGAHNAESSRTPQEVAAALSGLPVHVVPIGRTEEVRDVLLYRVDAPQVVVEGDAILIEVIVSAFRCAGEKTKIVLRKDGLRVDEQTLRFDKNRGDQRTLFEVLAPDLGRHEFEISVEPLEDEASTTNNMAQLTVDVVKDSLHILLADRIARWEYRYLDQLFRRDETVTFDKLLFHPEPTATGALAVSGGLPRDLSAWSEYDVVILGDLETAHLDEASQRALVEYVQTRGGNLIVIAGNESMPHRFARQPLMNLLPVESARLSMPTQGVQLALTSAGKMNPALTIADSVPESERAWKEQFRSLPIYFLSDYSRPKPTAEVLIGIDESHAAVDIEGRNPAHALMTWHRVGAGKVVYLASPATYRLRFRRGDGYHHRFWGQLLRWLTATERSAGTQTVRIMTDRNRYDHGDRVDVTVRLIEPDGTPVVDAEVDVSAFLGEKQTKQVALTADEKVPGRYLGAFTGLAPGGYRIAPTGGQVDRLVQLSSDSNAAETRITIASSESPELVNTQCNQALLRQIAEVTGGQVVPPTAIGELLTLSATAPEVIERIEREPLWNRWSLLGAAFACLCTEWILRKRLGLV